MMNVCKPNLFSNTNASIAFPGQTTLLKKNTFEQQHYNSTRAGDTLVTRQTQPNDTKSRPPLNCTVKPWKYTHSRESLSAAAVHGPKLTSASAETSPETGPYTRIKHISSPALSHPPSPMSSLQADHPAFVATSRGVHAVGQ